MKTALLMITFILGAVSASPTLVGKPATSVFEAAASNGQYGTSIQNECDGHLVVSNTGSGDYVWYKDVDFGSVGTEAIEITFSSLQSLGSTGTVSVRLDSYNGPSIAEITIGTTGNWCTYYPLTTILKTVPTGFHDVYFYFTSPYSSDLMHFYLFRFIETIY